MWKITLLISMLIITAAVSSKADSMEATEEVDGDAADGGEAESSMSISAEEFLYPDSSSDTLEDSSTYAEPRIRILKETDVSILDDNCNDGECRDFIYDDPREVVFFESKPAVRFTSDSTYVFKKPKQFEVLKFVDSKFANFPLNLFHSVKIHELDIRNCSMLRLTWDNFLMADQLSILLLSDNDLQEIPAMTFNSAVNLAFLFLDGNEIGTLYPESFKELPNLYMLDLHDNRLEILPEGVFADLPALQQLNLAGNHLRVIGDIIFVDNPRLVSVNLQRNRLEDLGEYAFQKQDAMDYIDVSHNAPLQTLVGNMRVDNLWARNCSISRVNIYGSAKNVDLEHNNIMELYFSRPESLETLRLSDNSLQQIASLSRATNLQYFDISHNPQLIGLPELWEADSLERLDLSNTSLTVIPTTILDSSERLKSLNVSYNLLTHIDPGNFKYFEKLNHFYIHHNNWNCYSLQTMMDMLIRPWKINYTPDNYDADFPGEYIGGIKCMYRSLEEENDDTENSLNEALTMSSLGELLQQNSDLSGQSSQLSEGDDSSSYIFKVEELRSEFKAIVGIYEQKFSVLLQKIDSLDQRLKNFEQFSKQMLQQITISV